MKMVWAMLVAVVLLGVAALVWPHEDGVDRSGSGNEPSASATSSSATTRASTPSPATAPRVEAKPAPTAASASPAAPPAAPIAAASASNAPPAKPTSATAAVTPAPSAPAATAAAPGGLTLGLDRTIAHAHVLPGSIVRQPDGSLLADGKFRIEGEGTRENPYRVTWDCLTSASRTYVPRLKQDGIPQWIAMLDNAWIRIDGYIAFPLMLQDSTEALVMLNQWDGCCIGVPPTPYDAIEAKLTEAVKPGKRHALNFGSLSGRLRVDPLLVENWLIGMYRVEDATLTQEGL